MINVIEKIEEIEKIDKIIELIEKQMLVIGNDKSKDDILTSLKNALKYGSRVKLFLYKTSSSKLAGFAFCNICSGLESGGDYLWINEIYVDELFRGQGIGEEMLKYIENWSLNNDILYLSCITSKSNNSSKNFYKKLSYELNDIVWVDKLLSN